MNKEKDPSQEEVDAYLSMISDVFQDNSEASSNSTINNQAFKRGINQHKMLGASTIMAQPTKKYFGSLSAEGLGKAFKVENKVQVHEKYGKQLKINAARWEDGGISIDVWDAEKKESINIGRLMVSTFDDKPKDGHTAAVTSGADGTDLPF